MSNPCREVITLQLGHYSNYVGTHWWNLQDASCDPDSPPAEVQSSVVFREGRTLGGHATHTPRLIAMDLKGSLRTLRQEGRLYDPGCDALGQEGRLYDPGTATSWEGSLMVHQESPPDKNRFLEDLEELEKGEILAEADFFSCPPSHSAGLRMDSVNGRVRRVQQAYRLEGSVKVWSDFLRIHLHPRTISVIHQYNHSGEAQRLETFGQGESLLQGALLEDLEDRLHFFVEECDYLQGFQVLCDLADGFSGLGSKVTEMLQDSYGGRGILTWGLAPVNHPNSTPLKDVYHMLNCALGTLHLANHSSLFCPLTLRGGFGRRPTAPVAFPLLNADPSLWFHSSGVLALALDALTLPYRLQNNGATMWQLADTLAVCGRKVAAAYAALPFPMMQGGSLPDALTAFADAPPWKPLSACPEPGDGRCYAQWAALRGFESQRLVSSLPAGIEPPTPLHGLHSGEEVMAAYIRSFYPAAPLALQMVSASSKLTPPFPQIFSGALGAQGFLQSSPSSPGAPSPVVSAVPVMTSLQSCPALGPWLAALHRGVRSLDIRRVAPSFLSQGPEQADYDDALEQLKQLACCYRDDSGGVLHSSSEEEDD